MDFFHGPMRDLKRTLVGQHVAIHWRIEFHVLFLCNRIHRASYQFAPSHIFLFTFHLGKCSLTESHSYFHVDRTRISFSLACNRLMNLGEMSCQIESKMIY